LQGETSEKRRRAGTDVTSVSGILVCVNAEPDTTTSGGREPAPGQLGLVQAFLNSNDIEAGREQLTRPEQLWAWLRERQLIGEDDARGRPWLSSHRLVRADGPLGEADLHRALAVREALRQVLLAKDGGTLDPTAVETLNRAAQRARLVVRFGQDGSANLEPDAPGVDGALGRLLAIVLGAMTDGSWNRLKACRSNTCRWAFWDASKNRSGAWCTMAVCGNRTKARAYRQRHQAAAESQ
jgi:predicted RNA-binding Zn ribbon-like protein